MSPDDLNLLMTAVTVAIGAVGAMIAHRWPRRQASKVSGPTLWDRQIVENERRHVDTGTTALAAELSPAPPRWVEGTEAWCEPAQETIEKIESAWLASTTRGPATWDVDDNGNWTSR